MKSEETDVQYVEVEPHWPGMARFFATAFTTHGFNYGAAGPVVSFMETIRWLALKDPEELEKIIEEWREKRTNNGEV